jgi:CheY-like chemotaxis protein
MAGIAERPESPAPGPAARPSVASLPSASDVTDALDALFGRGFRPPASRVGPPSGAAGPPAAPGAGPSRAPSRSPRIVTELISPEPLPAGPPGAPGAPSVEPPLHGRAAEPRPAPSAIPSPASLVGEDVEPIAAAQRRALVAEDSFAARVFLARLLGQLGYEVEAVERASDLERSLAHGPWDAVFVDVELPDARGAAFLAPVMSRLSRGARPALIAALTRDPGDDAEARAAGVPVVLRKPVSRPSLERVLAVAGLAAGRRS